MYSCSHVVAILEGKSCHPVVVLGRNSVLKLEVHILKARLETRDKLGQSRLHVISQLDVSLVSNHIVDVVGVVVIVVNLILEPLVLSLLA